MSSTPNLFAEIIKYDYELVKYNHCININPNSPTNCSPTDLDAAYSRLISTGDRNGDLQKAIDYQSGAILIADSTSTTGGNAPTIPGYTTNLQEIIRKHNEIVNLRRDLDMKLNELNKINNPYYDDSQLKYDVSVYSGILWTILASSIVYYVFVKI